MLPVAYNLSSIASKLLNNGSFKILKISVSLKAFLGSLYCRQIWRIAILIAKLYKSHPLKYARAFLTLSSRTSFWAGLTRAKHMQRHVPSCRRQFLSLSFRGKQRYPFSTLSLSSLCKRRFTSWWYKSFACKLGKYERVSHGRWEKSSL